MARSVEVYQVKTTSTTGDRKTKPSHGFPLLFPRLKTMNPSSENQIQKSRWSRRLRSALQLASSQLRTADSEPYH
jgi:hypothetical protein